MYALVDQSNSVKLESILLTSHNLEAVACDFIPLIDHIWAFKNRSADTPSKHHDAFVAVPVENYHVWQVSRFKGYTTLQSHLIGQWSDQVTCGNTIRRSDRWSRERQINDLTDGAARWRPDSWDKTTRLRRGTTVWNGQEGRMPSDKYMVKLQCSSGACRSIDKGE